MVKTILPDHMVCVWPYGVWLESLGTDRMYKQALGGQKEQADEISLKKID
jgi:hypothetical protein